MILQISQISTPLDAPADAAFAAAARQLSISPSEIQSASLVKTSVDARHGRVQFIHTVALTVEDRLGETILAASPKNVIERKVSPSPHWEPGSSPLSHRPVVVGLGPAGLFAALLLAQNGYHPLVLERGADLDRRVQAVERFWQEGTLDPRTNVQFGEGGAGTFSDGKLTTRISDPLCETILRELVRFGAPTDILTRAKPHIGTDLLREVVKAIRSEICRLGGEVQFTRTVTGFIQRQGQLTALATDAGDVACDTAILAMGHSARDTFSALSAAGAMLTAKPFSVGVRIEHRQCEIDRALYGNAAGHPSLPPAEYQLSHRVGSRALYTFCMCPGGQVVAAASGNGQVVTNGMSYRARNGENANAALVVSVDQADFGEGWQDAISFQEQLEHAAFRAGGYDYRAPAMKVGDLLGNHRRGVPPVTPTYSLGVEEADLMGLFPPQIGDFLRENLPILDRRLAGFASPQAMLTGIESRTSSPVRVLRHPETLEAVGLSKLYPCGEGAGYAGGILSAAVDGYRCAMALMQQFAPLP